MAELRRFLDDCLQPQEYVMIVARLDKELEVVDKIVDKYSYFD